MSNPIIPYNSYLKDLSRQLRNDSTLGEILLWNQIKGKKTGYVFNRQKPLLNYIVDFYCNELQLVIEIDGRYHEHEDRYAADLKKDHELEAQGLTIFRFTETEVKNDMDNALRTIDAYILAYTSKDIPL
jgi:very-short-patch-repair endonuclease